MPPSTEAPTTALGDARIITAAEFVFLPVAGADPTARTTVATPVSPAAGATHVTLHIVRVAAGESYTPEHSAAEENTVVVYSGTGTAAVGGNSRPVERGSAAYAPTGQALVLSADGAGMTAYVWRTPLAGAPSAARPSCTPPSGTTPPSCAASAGRARSRPPNAARP